MAIANGRLLFQAAAIAGTLNIDPDKANAAVAEFSDRLAASDLAGIGDS